MLIELNRFLTTEEVRREYHVPDPLAADVLPSLPVVIALEDGTLIHLESEVDQFLAEFCRRRRLDTAREDPSPRGRPGRKVETLEIALFAHELWRQGMTWKEVFKACRERWPEHEHVQNSEQVRKTHERHFKTSKNKSD